MDCARKLFFIEPEHRQAYYWCGAVGSPLRVPKWCTEMVWTSRLGKHRKNYRLLLSVIYLL